MLIQAIKWIDLAAVFLLELCMLAALGYWGVEQGNGAIIKVILGIGAPVLAAIVWGMFAAPKAKVHLRLVTQMAVRVVVFALAALALTMAAQRNLGIALFVAFCLTQGLALALGA